MIFLKLEMYSSRYFRTKRALLEDTTPYSFAHNNNVESLIILHFMDFTTPNWFITFSKYLISEEFL